MRPDPLRFLRTVRNLRPSQIVWRIRYRLGRSFPPNPKRWSFAETNLPSVRSDFLPIPPIRSIGPAADVVQRLSHGIFQHLNRAYALGRDHPDWRLGPCPADRLWTVTLHYHEWVFDLIRVSAGRGADAQAAASLVRNYLDDWITNCRLEKPGARELAWNPYTVATRIGWWVRSFLLASRQAIVVEAEFWNRFLRSLWQQAKYLRAHLEFDLRANHLLRNAVGLAWAGRFFDEPDAHQWLHTATKIALEQAEEQVLPDGGHFERSPMYHVHVMEDFLILALLLEDPDARGEIRQVWARMAQCLAWMRHPDGQITLLNDSALNGCCPPEEILEGAGHLGLDVQAVEGHGGKWLSDFGLFAWHGHPWTVFFDVGPIGVRYQPGHGHADTLTIEASLRGQRLLVDPGTWAYDRDPRRLYDRSTSAHNTVCVDGQDSSEVWHVFRCGRMAHVQDVQIEKDSFGFRAVASHTGYRHLPGRPVLHREVVLNRDHHLIIKDRCDGRGEHRVTGGWLLDPHWEAQEVEGGWRVWRPDCGAVQVHIQGPEELKICKSSRWYHPEFGRELLTTRLEWVFEGQVPIEITTAFAPEWYP